MNSAIQRIMTYDTTEDTSDTIVVKVVYTDLNGNVIENPDNAVKLSVTILNKVGTIRKSTAYLNSKNNPFILNDEVEAQLFSENMIKFKSVSKIKPVITELISTSKLISFSLSIKGFDNEVVLDEDLVSLIFSKFSCIEYDFERTTGVTMIMPYGTIKLKTFSLFGGNIILQNDGVAILAEDFIGIGGDCAISSNNEFPKFTLSAPKVNIHRIRFDSPINTAIIGKETDNLKVYQSYKADVSYVKFNLSEFDKPDSKTQSGIFKSPLLEIINMYKVNVSLVSVFGSQWYKTMAFEKITNLTVFDVDRKVRKSEVGIKSNTISVNNCINSTIFGLNIVDENSTKAFTKDGSKELFVYAVYLNGTSFIATSTISIADSNIDTVLLCNLDSLKASSLVTRKIRSKNSKYITCDEQTWTKFDIRDSHIDLSELLEIQCGNMTISNTTISSKVHGGILKLTPTYGLKLIGSILDLNDGDINILSKNVSEVVFKRDDIKAGSITVDHYPISKYLKSLNAVNESDREFSISNTSIKLDGELKVNDMWNAFIENSGLDCKAITLSNIKGCYWDSSSGLKSQEKNIALTFENLKFINSVVRNTTPGLVQDITMNNCTGKFSYFLASNKLDQIQKVNLTLNASKVNVNTITEGMSINTQLESNNSLGSTVYGSYLNCIIVPKYTSYDARKFKDSYGHIADNDAVYYGTSTEKLELTNILGL